MRIQLVISPVWGRRVPRAKIDGRAKNKISTAASFTEAFKSSIIISIGVTFLLLSHYHIAGQVPPGNFSSVSTFNCVSLYWNPIGAASTVEAKVRYRKKGT